MPRIPYPSFRCGIIFYKKKIYNSLYYFYYLLWGWAHCLLRIGPNSIGFFPYSDMGWAMFSVGRSYLLSSPLPGFISSGWPLMWLRFCLNKTFRHFKPINCINSSYGCRWFYELSCSELYQTGYKPVCNQTLFLISRSCHDLGRYYILSNDNYTPV